MRKVYFLHVIVLNIFVFWGCDDSNVVNVPNEQEVTSIKYLKTDSVMSATLYIDKSSARYTYVDLINNTQYDSLLTSSDLMPKVLGINSLSDFWKLSSDKYNGNYYNSTIAKINDYYELEISTSNDKRKLHVEKGVELPQINPMLLILDGTMEKLHR